MRQTQNAQVLQYMMTHGSITQKDAVEKYKCYRLSARIFELRKQDYPIVSDSVSFGGGYFARYKLRMGNE